MSSSTDGCITTQKPMRSVKSSSDRAEIEKETTPTGLKRKVSAQELHYRQEILKKRVVTTEGCGVKSPLIL